MSNPLSKLFHKVTDALPFYRNSTPGRIQRAFSSGTTGAGTESDVIESVTIQPRFLTRRYLEVIYANFWQAAKIVDLKPNDVFGPGIVWGDDEGDTQKMQEELRRLDFMNQVRRTVKAGRLFGSAVLILAPKDEDFLAPLDPDNIKPGEISHLLVADRYNLEELVLYADPVHPQFGQAAKYRWNFISVHGQPNEGQEIAMRTHIDIHASRCIRFDGIPPLSNDGWENAGEERWGISVLQRAIDDILQDAISSASLIDILKRACVPVVKKNGWTEVLSRGTGQVFMGEVSPEEAIRDISSNISNSKIMVIDKEDEIDKLEVQTSGVTDISKSQTERLAMIEGVPITRFTGQSATGLSATGEGDAKDWRITVEAYRKESIEKQWDLLMRIVAGNAGLSEVPDWEWGRLGETTLEEKASTTKTLSESVSKLVDSGIIDEVEARQVMNQSELVEVDEDDVPEVDTEMSEALSFGRASKLPPRQRMP